MGSIFKPYFKCKSSGTIVRLRQPSASALGMKDFGHRLRQARTTLRQQRGLPKLTLQEVADLIEVSPAAISQWERGTTIPQTETMLALPGLLQISPLWLLYGIGLPEQSGTGKIDPEVKAVGEVRVPKVAAIDFAKNIPQAVSSTSEYLPSFQPNVEPTDAYIEIWDSANTDRFQPGDYVMIRPTLASRVRPGDYVLAAIGAGQEPAFGALGRTDAGWQLVYDNPLWGRRPLTSDDRIVGVMIAHISKLRR